jgi:hypothetical protein
LGFGETYCYPSKCAILDQPGLLHHLIFPSCIPLHQQEH